MTVARNDLVRSEQVRRCGEMGKQDVRQAAANWLTMAGSWVKGAAGIRSRVLSCVKRTVNKVESITSVHCSPCVSTRSDESSWSSPHWPAPHPVTADSIEVVPSPEKQSFCPAPANGSIRAVATTRV